MPYFRGMEGNHSIRIPQDPEGAKAKRRKGPFTIRGIVIPVDWDHAGNVTAVSILTTDEDEYHVLWDEKGKALLSAMREEVEATGVLESRSNKKILRIRHFRRRANPGMCCEPSARDA